VRITEDNVNCTFLRDMNKLPPDSFKQSDVPLETLLLRFFEYYAQFDFQEKAISVIEGVPVRKTSNLPLHIVNPFDQSLNVSRNVSFEECQRLQAEVRNAAWLLESASEGPHSDDWGLLGLIEKKASKSLKKLLRAGSSHRLVSMRDLFKDNDEEEPESIKSKLEKITQKSDKEVEESVREMKNELRSKLVSSVKKETMKFKNRQVASEVYRIRRDKVL
jgi:poly(A) RNA polymerase, mitochondrial